MALINRLPCELINIQSVGNKTNKRHIHDDGDLAKWQRE